MLQMICINLNGERRAVPDNMTIAWLLEHYSIEPKMVVVELNGEIISRDKFWEARVKSDANVEIVQMMAGG
jgi:thiamine biosynthesis protein ThiS